MARCTLVGYCHVVGGLLVGFGTRLGSGCTSDHGLCGIARLSLRSIAATGIFMVAAIAVVADASCLQKLSHANPSKSCCGIRESVGLSRCLRRLGSKPGGCNGSGTHGSGYRLRAGTTAIAPVRREKSVANKETLIGRWYLERSYSALAGVSLECPGPAVANLATLSPSVMLFVIAMTMGMLAYDFWSARAAGAAQKRFVGTADADG
jgi:Sulphur transport